MERCDLLSSQLVTFTRDQDIPERPTLLAKGVSRAARRPSVALLGGRAAMPLSLKSSSRGDRTYWDSFAGETS